MTPEQHPELDDLRFLVALAGRALVYGMDEDYEQCMAQVELIARMETADFPAYAHAISYWIGMLRHHMLDGEENIRLRVGMEAFFDPDQDGKLWVVGSAEADMELPAWRTWAASIVTAGLNEDHDRFDKLFNESPQDGEFLMYFAAVLDTVVTSMKTFKRGWALTKDTPV